MPGIARCSVAHPRALHGIGRELAALEVREHPGDDRRRRGRREEPELERQRTAVDQVEAPPAPVGVEQRAAVERIAPHVAALGVEHEEVAGHPDALRPATPSRRPTSIISTDSEIGIPTPAFDHRVEERVLGVVVVVEVAREARRARRDATRSASNVGSGHRAASSSRRVIHSSTSRPGCACAAMQSAATSSGTSAAGRLTAAANRSRRVHRGPYELAPRDVGRGPAAVAVAQLGLLPVGAGDRAPAQRRSRTSTRTRRSRRCRSSRSRSRAPRRPRRRAS